MNHCPESDFLLVFPHLLVQNANAISGSMTHGFPSMTAFLGLMWALERKAHEKGIKLAFNAVGVVSHGYQEQVNDGYVKSFNLTRNPIGKDEKTAAIVEEGRIHLELSLVFGITTPDASLEQVQADTKMLAALLQTVRIAGGTLLPPQYPWRKCYQPFVTDLTGNDETRDKQFKELKKTAFAWQFTGAA